MDHYGGNRPSYSCVDSDGIEHTLVRLDGPDAGDEIPVLDASSGYASSPLGAGPPGVAERLISALRDGTGYTTDEIGDADRATFLDRVVGPHGLWSDRFPIEDYHVSGRNSGSEGMELALRLALEARFDRQRLRPTEDLGDRSRILAFEGAWHGWTQAVRPLINRRHYRAGLPGYQTGGRLPVEVDHIPFGHRSSLEEYFEEHGDDLLAVVVEPIQGDAGILLPPEGYLRELSRRCESCGALLIADEILTFAKTGQYFAMTDDRGPIPTDITVIGKYLGMGVLSTSLVFARRQLGLRPSGGVSTSDLRPITCQVMDAGIEHIEREGLIQRSAKHGELLRRRLEDRIVSSFPHVFQEVRGAGILNGLEFTEESSGNAAEIRRHMIENGVYAEIMAGAGRRSGDLSFVFPVLRLTPPLVASEAELEEIVERMRAGLTDYVEAARGRR